MQTEGILRVKKVKLVKPLLEVKVGMKRKNLGSNLGWSGAAGFIIRRS